MNYLNVLALSSSDKLPEINNLNCDFKISIINEINELKKFPELKTLDVFIVDFVKLQKLDCVLHNEIFVFCESNNISIFVLFDCMNEANNAYCNKFTISNYAVYPFDKYELKNRLDLLFSRRKESVSLCKLIGTDLVLDNEDVISAQNDLENIKSNFFYMMSTELRNPLNGIVGFLDMLEFSIKNKTHLKYISYIKEASRKLISISDLSMLLTSIKANRYKSRIEAVDLKSIIDNILLLNKSELKDKKLKINLIVQKDALEIFSDKKLMSICIGKIILDAIDNSPKGGIIDIEIKSVNNSVDLIISDQGFSFTNKNHHYTYSYFEATKTNRMYEARFTPGLIIASEFMGILQSKLNVGNSTSGEALIKFNFPKSLITSKKIVNVN